MFVRLNVFAHDVQATLAQWRIHSKEGEPTVLAEHLSDLIERYPNLRLFIGDAFFSGRDLCQAIRNLKRHYVVRIKGNQGDIEETLRHWFETKLKPTADAEAKPEKKGRCLPAALVAV